MKPHKRQRQYKRDQTRPHRPHRREVWATDDDDRPHASSSTAQFPPTAYVAVYEARLTYPTPDDLDYRGQWRGRETHKDLMPWAGDDHVLADRYDLIHLLDALPSASSSGSAYDPLNSRVGQADSDDESADSAWSLPSDEEALWTLDSEAAREAYVRDKRRKWVDGLREARLREREAEDASQAEPEKADEEAPPAVAALMAHTALSLARSPDPTTLEIKIMTHHASDARFAFLRGQWASAWARAKVDAAQAVRREKGLDKEKGLGGLMGEYSSGSDDDIDDDDDDRNHDAENPAPEPDEPPPAEPTVDDVDRAVHREMVAEAARMAERRARAARWKAERAQAKQDRQLREEI
ncbi:hypothetical protein Q5752_003528 [Cryptotrichosporon argae]